MPSSTRLRPGHVLVVDDDELVARALARVLSREHAASYVTSAAAALADLESGATYDVILCDVQMPGMSGIDMYREIERRKPELASRVVFMTGDPDYQSTRAFLDATPNLCLAKPLDFESLHELIERRIRAPESKRASRHD
jgi:CheY-like chemotaxis protein